MPCRGNPGSLPTPARSLWSGIVGNLESTSKTGSDRFCALRDGGRTPAEKGHECDRHQARAREDLLSHVTAPPTAKFLGLQSVYGLMRKPLEVSSRCEK